MKIKMGKLRDIKTKYQLRQWVGIKFRDGDIPGRIAGVLFEGEKVLYYVYYFKDNKWFRNTFSEEMLRELSIEEKIALAEGK